MVFYLSQVLTSQHEGPKITPPDVLESGVGVSILTALSLLCSELSGDGDREKPWKESLE
jgi:hypothetical protein